MTDLKMTVDTAGVLVDEEMVKRAWVAFCKSVGQDFYDWSDEVCGDYSAMHAALTAALSTTGANEGQQTGGGR